MSSVLSNRLSVQPPVLFFSFNATFLITQIKSDTREELSQRSSRECTFESYSGFRPTPAGGSAVTHSFPTATSIHHHRAIMRLRYDHRQVYGYHLRAINRPRVHQRVDTHSCRWMAYTHRTTPQKERERTG